MTVVGTITPPFNDDTCKDVNAQLSGLRGNDVSNGSVDWRTHYYGVVTTGAGSVTGGFLRGCSEAPNSPDPSAIASGPAGDPGGLEPLPGSVSNGLDLDSSFADWYGGHELGHSFGRQHPGFCDQTKDDSNFPFPFGNISDIQGSFVALDFGDAALATTGASIVVNPPPAGVTALPRTVLPGTSTTEIMTYCLQPRWPSSYTYTAIRKRLIDEDAQVSGSGGGDRGGDGELGRGPAVHVVGSLDLTARTGAIRYVFPVARFEPQRLSAANAALLVLDEKGRVASRTKTAIRLLTDRPLKSHQIALIDASVPASPEMARIQLVLGKHVLAEFASTFRKPSSPTSAKIRAPLHDAQRAPGVPTYLLMWTASSAAGDSIFYTVEVLGKEKRWETIGIGLTRPELGLTPEQTQATLRVTATNGFVNSDPLIIPGRL